MLNDSPPAFENNRLRRLTGTFNEAGGMGTAAIILAPTVETDAVY